MKPPRLNSALTDDLRRAVRAHPFHPVRHLNTNSGCVVGIEWPATSSSRMGWYTLSAASSTPANPFLQWNQYAPDLVISPLSTPLMLIHTCSRLLKTYLSRFPSALWRVGGHFRPLYIPLVYLAIYLQQIDVSNFRKLHYSIESSRFVIQKLKKFKDIRNSYTKRNK